VFQNVLFGKCGGLATFLLVSGIDCWNWVTEEDFKYRYVKALKKYTPTGVATLNQRIFIKLYAGIRPFSLSERAIRAA
jgi:hypothetical protein